MLNDPNSKLCGVLFVDDEEKALKYFRVAFEARYRIYTAESAAAGLKLLETEAPNIGLVLSDQRMPEMLGAEFLGIVRERYPRIVRILTTAYSDLESAIQAVNKGHIYQYVVKPWEIPELGMVLHRAADYYQVLTERDGLLRMKMTTLQRIVCSDRVKSLLLASRALAPAAGTHVRRAVGALVQAMPDSLDLAGEAGAGTAARFDIAGLLRAEYRNSAATLDQLTAAGEPLDGALEKLRAALPGATSEAGADGVSVLRVPAADATQAAAITRQIFGALAEPEGSVVAGLMLRALVAAAAANRPLVVVLEGPAPAELRFEPGSAPEIAETLIDALYEKFSAADISRL